MQKRNNVFMLSYITFIIVSIIFRCFIDYELWGPIVLAVTTSSILFAIEDFFRSMSQFSKDMYEIGNSLVQGSKEKIAKDLKMMSTLDQKVSKYKDYNDKLNRYIELIKDQKISMEKIIKVINEIEESSIENYKLQKKYFNIANILAYLGFLTLFCVLIFASLFTISTLEQEIITVMTFAIILFTQYINVIITKRIKENSKISENSLSKYDKVQKILQNINVSVNEIIENIDKSENSVKD